jgi:hypothetical protein
LRNIRSDHDRSSRNSLGSLRRLVHFTPDVRCFSCSPRTSPCRRARSQSRMPRLLPWARSLMADVDSGILPVSGHAGSAGPIPEPAALRPNDIFICQTDRPDWSRCGVRRQPQSPARAAMPSSCHRGHGPGSKPDPICGCHSGARSTRLPVLRPCFRDIEWSVRSSAAMNF